MFTKICALLRRKPVEPVLAQEPIAKPRRKPTIKKVTAKKVVTKKVASKVTKPVAKKAAVKTKRG